MATGMGMVTVTVTAEKSTTDVGVAGVPLEFVSKEEEAFDRVTSEATRFESRLVTRTNRSVFSASRAS